MAFLPVTREEMEELGWEAPDFVLVTGDAYVCLLYTSEVLQNLMLLYRRHILPQSRNYCIIPISPVLCKKTKQEKGLVCLTGGAGISFPYRFCFFDGNAPKAGRTSIPGTAC